MADGGPGVAGEPQIPPAWYPDGTGHLRWWDGRQWGPWAPAPASGALTPVDERTWALLAHLGIVVGGFVVPLVVRYAFKDRSRFVLHHATEALNFQITTMVAGVLATFAAFAILAVSAGTDSAWALLFLPLVLLVVFAPIGLSILGAVRAHQGAWWRYPCNVRLVRGAVAAHEDPAPLPRG